MATKIFNLVGADHKVGVTMISQALGEVLSSKGFDRSVLLLHLDGRDGSDFMQLPTASGCIDAIYQPLMQRLASTSELTELIVKEGNLSMLVGSRNNDCSVRYTPEITEDIINTLKDEYDIVLIDSGANANSNGLSVGAYEYDCPNILITTQQESAYRRFLMDSHDVYMKFTSAFDAIIINKYLFSSGKMLMSDKELWGRYGFDEGYSVVNSDAGWQAEIDRKSLLEYDKQFRKDITRLASQLILG